MTKLRPTDRKFIKSYAELNGNGTQAVKKVFKIKDNNYAAVKATRLLRKDNIQKELKDMLPDDLLREKHLELLNKRDRTGIETNAVSRGLDMAYRVKGMYAPEKHLNLNADLFIATEQEKENALKALKEID